jgi:hypothetical protein
MGLKVTGNPKVVAEEKKERDVPDPWRPPGVLRLRSQINQC